MAAFSLSHIQHVHSEGKYKSNIEFAFEFTLLLPVSSMYLLLNRHLYFQLNFLTFSRKTEHIILYQARVAVEDLTEHRSKICIVPSSSSQGMGNLKKEYLVLYWAEGVVEEAAIMALHNSQDMECPKLLL